MAVQSIIKNTVNLDEPIKKQILTDVLGGSDNQAHRFEVELIRGGQAVSLSGATVYGYFIRPGDITVKLTGGVSGSTAYVVLNEHCYVTPGRFSFAMKVQVGEVLHTVLLYEGCVAVTQGEGVVDDGYTIPSLTEWMNNIRKPNLLDNSDFRNPVNQRGETSYNATGYTVDRWYSNMGGNCTVTIGTDKIALSKANSGGSFRQTLPMDLTGKTMTYAVKTANGITCRSAVISGASTYVQIDGLKAYLGVAVSGGNTIFQIYFNDSSTIELDIYWAALYEGSYTAETLPEYVSKGYAAELAECMRYFQVCNNSFFCGTPDFGTNYIGVNFYAPMRVVPTISLASINGVSATLAAATTCGFIATNANSANAQMVWEASADL